jgi:hypothetical protein
VLYAIQQQAANSTTQSSKASHHGQGSLLCYPVDVIDGPCLAALVLVQRVQHMVQQHLVLQLAAGQHGTARHGTTKAQHSTA